jgi:fumarylacetoacetate (FAA) hydrolase family protein
VALPGEAFDTDLGDIAAEAAIALKQAAANAAASPAGPLPTTSTSVWRMTSICRLGSVICIVGGDLF